MKANEIIKLFIYDTKLAEVSGTFEYSNDENGNTNCELIEIMFGTFVDVIGTLDDGVDYLYQYSDTYQPVCGKVPDAIVVLQDGRCVFLYAIE